MSGKIGGQVLTRGVSEKSQPRSPSPLRGEGWGEGVLRQAQDDISVRHGEPVEPSLPGSPALWTGSFNYKIMIIDGGA
jgi:hypothetical protein